MGQQQMTLPGLEPTWTLGDRLRKAREVAGLNQSEMAESIGIARNSVGRYESGGYDPPRPVLIAWAFRTGVALDWITGQGSEQPETVTDPDIPSGMPVDHAEPPTTAELKAMIRRRIPLTMPEIIALVVAA